MPIVFCDDEGAPLEDETQPLEDDGDDAMAQCPIEQEDDDALFITQAHLDGSGIGNETMTATAEQVENASCPASLACSAMLLCPKMAVCSILVLIRQA